MTHEGDGRLPHLGRALGPEVGHVAPLAEGLGRIGEAAYGANLLAHEDGGDGEEDERGADHPQDEDIGGGAEQPPARQLHMQHAVVELHLHLDLLLQRARVDQELAADEGGEGGGQLLVHQIVADQDRAVRQARLRPEDDLQLHLVLGDREDPRVMRGARIELHRLDHRRDVAGHALRQPPRHRVPVAVVEHPGRHHLQQDQRRHDDHQRAAEQRARQHAVDLAADAPAQPGRRRQRRHQSGLST